MVNPVLPEQFAEFIVAARDHAPYAWQQRLCQQVLATGCWPQVIDAPTGAGKSSVIDVHVFAVAVSASGGAAVRLPRRLVITVDRRALVDDHADRAQALAQRLNNALDDGQPGVVHDVAEALAALRTWPGEAGPADVEKDSTVLQVATLRGGAPRDRDWLDDPAACQVIAATPQMWGSRLLFGGYGSSRGARPREAGLLAMDSVVVLDEAHLNHQLLTTARRVRELVSPQAERHGLLPLQVVAMTATPAVDAGSRAGVEPADLDGPDPAARALAARLTRPKPVTVLPSRYLPTKASTRGRLAQQIADAVLDLAGHVEGTVGCVVNTVNLALAVSERLRNSTVPGHAPRDGAGERPLTVVPLVGRMRPYDVAQVRSRYPGLFTPITDASVDVVVATQTIEVGIDMDLAGLVTELAPGSAIAQRAGRVNRTGTRALAPVVVVVPEDSAALSPTAMTAPYCAEDLAAALDWVQERAEDPAGVAAWSLHPAGGGHIPPVQSPRRPVHHRPEAWNVQEWARTSQRPFAEPELTLWLEDDLQIDQTVAVVVRAGLPEDVASARLQLDAALPLPHEMFPARRKQVAELIGDVTRVGTFRDGSARVLIVRAAEVLSPEMLDAILAAPAERLRPGDTVVIGTQVRAFRSFGPDEESRISAFDPGEAEQTADDVADLSLDGAIAAHAQAAVRIGQGTMALAGVPGDEARGLFEDMTELSSIISAVDRDAALLDLLRSWLGSSTAPPNPSRQLLSGLLQNDDSVTVTLSPATDTAPPWAVVSGQARAEDDDEFRQSSSPRRQRVRLADHSQAVAEAARALAEQLTMTSHTVQVLHQAGLLHDVGKQDARFQRTLRTYADQHPGEVLAKSGMRDRNLIRRARSAVGLPGTWRHEQLSAASAWSQTATDPPELRDLITRLVGTSHGYGRSGFDDTTRALLSSGDDLSESAAELFDEGLWEELVERTDATWGPWGSAYLEALLRAADCTVSRRGS